MGIFKKLFKKKKNEIHLSAEEAFEAGSENIDAPEQAAPPVEKDAQAAGETVPEANSENTFEPEEREKLGANVFWRADPFENASLELRAALRELVPDISENDATYHVTLSDRSRIELSCRPSPGLAGLPEALRTAEGELKKPVGDILDSLNQKIEIVPCARGEAFEESYALFKGALLSKLNAFELTKDNCITDAQGTLVINAEGESEYGVSAESAKEDESASDEPAAENAAETAGNEPGETQQQSAETPEAPFESERAKRSKDLIRSHGILLDCDRAVEIDEGRIYPRSVKETAERISALTATSLIANAYLKAGNISPAARCAALVSRFESLYGVKRQFTAKENAYLRDPASGKHAVNALKGEAARTLMWALGYVELDWPDAPADIDKIGEILRQSDLNSLCSKARPRDKQVLLDMYDLTTRLHALCVRASLKDLKTTGLDPDVIYERHYALNWLLGIGGYTAWDNIIPTT